MKCISAVAFVLALAACGNSDPAAAICTHADVDQACAEPTTAVQQDDGSWEVNLRMTVTEEVPYRDGGVQCSYIRKRCAEQDCYYYGDPSMTMQQAIQECEDSYYGR